MGARVIAVDISAERGEMALSRGADVVIDPSADDPVQAIKDLTHGEGADKALDATSSADARRNAVRSTRAWGTACLVGIGGDVQLKVLPDLIHRQITLVGHWTFSKIASRLRTFRLGSKIDVDSLFTHKWKLEDAEEAYQLFDQQKTGKGVFLPA